MINGKVTVEVAVVATDKMVVDALALEILVPLVMDGTSLMQKSLMIRHPVWISRTSAHLMTMDLTC
jgi:hypothetical protein